MDGLSAVFQTDGAPADAGVLRRMSEAAAHRGRETSERIAGSLALAHRRGTAALSDRQPVVDEAAGLTLLLTGRLYNRDEVAAALTAEGASAGDGSQTRTILAAYRQWGDACVERFDGDFAFVLHDARRRALLGARDALGVKPLFYAFDGHRFLAASEPKQLLAAGVAAAPCDDAIASYLALTRFLFDGPRTFYRDVLRLEPGHRLLVDARGVRVERYWAIDPLREVEERSEEEMAARVRGILEDAVRRRLPEAAPYGCALTGGFDSSSVAVLLRRALDAQGIRDSLETFSFEFRDPEADEPELIDLVAREVRARHHHLYLDGDDVFDVLPGILAAGDEPAHDMGLLYLWRKKERAAAVGVSVVMSGLGGDELFCGRFHYLADLFRAGRIGDVWREIQGLYPVDRSTGRRTSRRNLIARYVIKPLVPRAPKLLARRLMRDDPVPPWISEALARRTGLPDRIRQGPPSVYADAYRQDCWEVFRYVLVNLTLPVHEALGAWFSVDTRFPLLDRRLVEYMFAAPREQKIRLGQTRVLQRRAMAGILPDAVVREHLKKNPHPVFSRQQHGNFKRELARLFAEPSHLSDDYIDWRVLAKVYARYLQGHAPGEPLWYALNVERWLGGVVNGR